MGAGTQVQRKPIPMQEAPNTQQQQYPVQQQYPLQQQYPPQEQYPPQQQYPPQEQYPPQHQYLPQQQYPQQQQHPQQYPPQEQSPPPQQIYPPPEHHSQNQQYPPQESFQPPPPSPPSPPVSPIQPSPPPQPAQPVQPVQAAPLPLPSQASPPPVSEYHIVPTPLATYAANVSNKHIIPATQTTLAIPIVDTPCPKEEFPNVRKSHNAALQRLMVERGVSRFWRYARVTGDGIPVNVSELSPAQQVLTAILTCGLSLCFGNAPPRPPAPADSSKATSGPQLGYFYYLVSEIPCQPQEILDHFGDQYGISNFGAGTAAQDCLWTWNFGEKSVAAGGGWANLPKETEVEVKWGWIWVYLYGKTTGVRKATHGLPERTTVGVALEAMMAAERETLEKIAVEGWRGRAVPVWPPVMVNGTVVA